ncbi:uncharacterized protein [Drosophila suzukii]|uniref:DUF5641 domain-containing protein n=1 Tax=Drosophila suzukii TaxID=28584 RepID=A0AB40D680_DROSZ
MFVIKDDNLPSNEWRLGRIFDTAAIIDLCTSTSSMDASVASAYPLPTTNAGDEGIRTATTRSKFDEAIKLEVVLKIAPKVWIRTPIRALSESVVEKFWELPLADERFNRPATISLILGDDVYPKAIQPGFHMVDEGLPVAQKTVFGWILSGTCTQV